MVEKNGELHRNSCKTGFLLKVRILLRILEWVHKSAFDILWITFLSYEGYLTSLDSNKVFLGGARYVKNDGELTLNCFGLKLCMFNKAL